MPGYPFRRVEEENGIEIIFGDRFLSSVSSIAYRHPCFALISFWPLKTGSLMRFPRKKTRLSSTSVDPLALAPGNPDGPAKKSL